MVLNCGEELKGTNQRWIKARWTKTRTMNIGFWTGYEYKNCQQNSQKNMITRKDSLRNRLITTEADTLHWLTSTSFVFGTHISPLSMIKLGPHYQRKMQKWLMLLTVTSIYDYFVAAHGWSSSSCYTRIYLSSSVQTYSSPAVPVIAINTFMLYMYTLPIPH